MNWIINMACKLSGLNWIMDKINGYKTYIAAISLMLGGVASMATGAAGILAEIIPLNDFAAILAWSKTVAHDTNAGIFMAGWLAFHNGLASFGQRHALDKTASVPVEPTPAPVAPAGPVNPPAKPVVP